MYLFTRRALEIKSKAGLPLMVHYSFSTIPHVAEDGTYYNGVLLIEYTTYHDQDYILMHSVI